MNLRAYLKRFSVVVMVLVATAVVGYLMMGRASAENNGNPSILNAVLNVQNTLNAADAVNYRFTPPVSVAPGDKAECDVVNILSVTRTVLLQLLNEAGQVREEDIRTVGAGQVVSVAFSSAGGPPSPSLAAAYCKFTVVDGTRANIRGTLNITSSGAIGAKLSVPAE